jgi:L-aminopeptidase/D-esterase-like protein
VALCPQGKAAGVDVCGGAPSKRDTGLLQTQNAVDRVHEALATGGSAQSVSLALVGALASEVTARAVLQAVRHAVSQAAPHDLPALRDLVNIA